MNLFSATHAQLAFFAGYLFCFVALNVIAFLISLFYRKKLQKPSPRWGFLAAIILAFISSVLILGSGNGSSFFNFTVRISLVASVAASAFSTLSLFFIMRRVRK